MYLYLALSASDLYPHLASLNKVAANDPPGCCFCPLTDTLILIHICLVETCVGAAALSLSSSIITFVCPSSVTVVDTQRLRV